MIRAGRKRLVILGATGSIGRQCLDVVRRHRDKFEIVGLTTHRRVADLAAAVSEFQPQVVVVGDRSAAEEWSVSLQSLGTRVLVGQEALADIVEWRNVDLVVNGLVGAVGLLPTYRAVSAGRNVALANKESLVVGGALIMPKARETGAKILPIDSEHSAIFQCLMGEPAGALSRILLTGSGGPFRTTPLEELERVTVEQALAHPNWVMGPKITIDSATLMNKGLEVIEAHWLFGLPVSRIQVVIHPQSIVHSMVELVDGSVKAQLGLPDMRLPIQLALSYPERLDSDFPRVDFFKVRHLDFEEPNLEKFPALRLAYDAAEAGGTAPAVLNASNEVAVQAFLEGRIRYLDIARVIETVLTEHSPVQPGSVEDLLSVDEEARQRADETIRTLENSAEV